MDKQRIAELLNDSSESPAAPVTGPADSFQYLDPEDRVHPGQLGSPPSTRKWMKMCTAFGASSVALLIFLRLLTGGGSSSTEARSAAAANPPEETETVDPKDEEIADLKKQLALQTQHLQMQLSEWEEQRAAADEPELDPPEEVAIAAPVDELPPPAPPAPAPALDPLQTWQALSQLGSWGTVNPRLVASRSAPTRANYNQTDVGGRPAPALQGSVETAQVTPRDLEAEATVLRGRVRRRVPVASRATGELTTPVYWSDATDPQAMLFVVRLSQGLADSRGVTAIPSETEIVAQIAQVDASTGFVRLEGVTALIPGADGTTEMPLPAGAVTIGGVDAPLIAERANDVGGDIAALDVGTAIVSGLSSGARVMNLPRSSSSSFSSGFGGSYSSTSESRDPNFWLGFLEGGAGSVAEEMQRRNRHHIEQLQEQAALWQLPAGTPVSIFISKPLSF